MMIVAGFFPFSIQINSDEPDHVSKNTKHQFAFNFAFNFPLIFRISTPDAGKIQNGYELREPPGGGFTAFVE